MVLGYVVMRVPMIAQWARAAGQDPARREVCKIFILTLVVSQLGWVGLLFLDLSIGRRLRLRDRAGPGRAGRARSSPSTSAAGTPWHAHHIAERYGLMVIIALGEGLLGTTAALGALIGETEWSLDIALLGLAGVGDAVRHVVDYFVMPCGDLLHAYRSRVFGWGYGHIPLFGAVVAIGAGLHAAAYYLEHHSTLSGPGTLLTIAVPLVGVLLGSSLLYAALTRTLDPLALLDPRRLTRRDRRRRDRRCPSRARPCPSAVLVLSRVTLGDRGGVRDGRPPSQRRGAGGAAPGLTRVSSQSARRRGRG